VETNAPNWSSSLKIVDIFNIVQFPSQPESGDWLVERGEWSVALNSAGGAYTLSQRLLLKKDLEYTLEFFTNNPGM
jgi:hypothetical protein